MSYEPAPEHPLPSTSFYAVEYPGYVQSSSIERAVRTLGGHNKLNASFRKNALVELRFHPDNSFSHPVSGDIVRTSNLVLKVTKRRKKKPATDTMMDIDDGLVAPEVAGEYTTEVVGSTSKTIRFRSMVDFQYQPDPNDRITKLRASIDQMDARAIQNFQFEPELEDYTIYEPSTPSTAAGPFTDHNITTEESEGHNREEKAPVARSNVRMFPPPLFSRQGIQQNYNYKQNPVSVPQTVVDEETGIERQRLVNKYRWKGIMMIFVSVDDNEVPTQPPEAPPAIKAKIDMNLLERIKQKFETRPVWSRIGLYNQLSAKEVKELSYYSNKSILALACYAFKGGPFHDLLVRFGYDPRLSIESRQYQRLFFRDKDQHNGAGRRRKGFADASALTSSKRLATPNWTLPNHERNTNSHIFDGKSLTTEGAGFQVCDVTDPVLKLLLANESYWRSEFHEHDGWYKPEPLDRIKALMRRKFIGLKEGRLYTDEESMEFIQQPGTLVEENGEKIPRSYKYHGQKKNRAKKGMSEPERQAARLRAALQRDGAGAEESAGGNSGGVA